MNNSIIIIRQSKKRYDDILAYIDPKESRLKEKIDRYKKSYPKDIIIIAQVINDLKSIKT